MEKTITISYKEYLELVAKKEAYDNESVILKEESFDEKYTSMHRDEELKSEIEKRKSIEQEYSDYKQKSRGEVISLRQQYDNEISDLKTKLRHANDRGNKFEREYERLHEKYKKLLLSSEFDKIKMQKSIQELKRTIYNLSNKSIFGFIKWKNKYLKQQA